VIVAIAIGRVNIQRGQGSSSTQQAGAKGVQKQQNNETPQ